MKKRIAEMMIMMLLTGMLMLAFDIKQAGSSEPSARQPTNQPTNDTIFPFCAHIKHKMLLSFSEKHITRSSGCNGEEE